MEIDNGKELHLRSRDFDKELVKKRSSGLVSLQPARPEGPEKHRQRIRAVRSGLGDETKLGERDG